MRKLVLLIAATLAMTTALFHISNGLTPKVDVFWVYSIGFKWFEPSKTATVESKYVPQEIETQRRDLMVWNYPVSAVTSYAMSKLPLSLPWSIGLSHITAFAIGLAIALMGAKYAPLPFGLTVSFYALLGFLPGPIPTDHLFMYRGPEAFFNIVAILGNSGEVYSPLSFWQRNTALLIIIGGLALRWSGRKHYPLIACIAFFHINFAIVALALFLGADIVRRLTRNRLPDPLVIVGLCVFGAVTLSGLYAIVASGDLWGPESALSQMAARLLAIAHVVTVFWASWEASKWLSRKYVPEVVVAVLLVALPMTTYGMFGSWWKKGPEIKRDFSSIDAITDPLARDYYLVVRDLTSQTDHQSK